MTYENGHVEFDNIEAVHNVTISNEGKLWGLTKYKGQGAYLVIPKEIKIKEGNIYFSAKQSEIIKKLIKMNADYLKDVDCILERLEKKSIPSGWWLLIFDSIVTFEHKLTEEERREIIPVSQTLDKKSEILPCSQGLIDYEKKIAKEWGGIEFRNELEKRLFSTWLLNSDGEVGMDKMDIRKYLKKTIDDEQKRKELLQQLRKTSDWRLFDLFSAADSY